MHILLGEFDVLLADLDVVLLELLVLGLELLDLVHQVGELVLLHGLVEGARVDFGGGRELGCLDGSGPLTGEHLLHHFNYCFI